MDGIIISYDVISAREVVDLNNSLFGRIVSVNRNNRRHYYYYTGLLSDSRYYKITNGCYFITKEDIPASIYNDNRIKIIFAEHVTIGETLITAREHFRKKYIDKMVRNLD